MWQQKIITLTPKPRGFHLITDEVIQQVQELSKLTIGLAHCFIQHTSASLTINENADSTVRSDFDSFFNQAVPENLPFYKHTQEGPDDMPAHIKASLLGTGVMIPVTNGTLNLGTWQGLYLCEHRNHGGNRKIVVTLMGE